MVNCTCAASELSHSKGVALCHRLYEKVVKFELMVLDQSQKKLLGKNCTSFITAV